MTIAAGHKNYIWKIFGKQSVPRVAILGASHGDEVVGKQIIDQLLRLYGANDIKGSLILILGNPEAYKQKKRFVDVDLNRLWSKESIAQIAAKSHHECNIEEQRLLQVKPVLQNVDFLLDIHATIKKTPYSFAYCKNSKAHLALAEKLQVDCIISPETPETVTTMNSCCDDYVDSQGGMGITLETGWLQDRTVFARTLASVNTFLSSIGVIESVVPHDEIKQRFVIYREVIAQTDDFRFLHEVENFERFSAEEVFALDGGKSLIVDRDSVMVFPKVSPAKDQPAGYLAYECEY